MKVKLTGFMNYVETSIEESWVKAISDIGLKVGNPKSIKLYNMGVDPIICRKAKNQRGSTEYERWFDEELFFTKPNGAIDGVYLETVASYLNDTTKTYEVVSFELRNNKKDYVMDLCLFFNQGHLTSTDDQMAGEGITIPDVLNERGFKLAGRDEAEMLQNAIGDKGTYVDMFKLFLEKLKG